MNHRALAQAIYEAHEWSGCNGSRWDALPAEAQCFRVDAAAAYLATLEAAGFAVVQLPEPDAALAQRLYVALVEQRNIDGRRYGEFQYAPIGFNDAWGALACVAAAGSVSGDEK